MTPAGPVEVDVPELADPGLNGSLFRSPGPRMTRAPVGMESSGSRRLTKVFGELYHYTAMDVVVTASGVHHQSSSETVELG
jgi:hypothetical protein